jgi:hypothetical protein
MSTRSSQRSIADDRRMTSAKAPVVRRQLEPTHACIRCGREGVPADAGLCELCNPLELSQPSATQMHGIAAVGIIGFIVVLAVLGRVVLSGTGPFTGQAGSVAGTGDGLSVVLSVTNEGKKAASTTCSVAESPARVGQAIQVVQTPLIQPGATVQFTAVLTKLGTKPVPLIADCASP